jgi:Mg2+-importing ATPase
VVRLEGAYDAAGDPSSEVARLATLNATLETGLNNPLDEAIVRAGGPADVAQPRKLGEIPFDSVRKRVSVVVQHEQGGCLISKGAFGPVLDSCTRLAGGGMLDASMRAQLTTRAEAWAKQGIRVLGVATSTVDAKHAYTRADETDLAFCGFLTFLDRPKQDAATAIAQLARLGVSIKLITGDSVLVAQHVAAMVGLRADRALTGRDLQILSNEALWRTAERTDIFAEVDSNQKERIILAMKKMGHVVGFLGDGVNDAPAMHAADTSLAVSEATDVTRAVADFVLLDRDLDVIRRGVEEGRRTFANTLKYVLTTTSANLGNMVSMAAASLFLPFLPMLAGQILLNNFLSDIPAIGIADDSVDPELVERPERWDMRFIGRFMIEFGLLSSVFDLLTFGPLLTVFAAAPPLFRTAWFIESMLTELVIALVVRTRRPFYRSRPGKVLVASTALLVPLTFIIPWLPRAALLGFEPIPFGVAVALVGITILYVLASEIGKHLFYRTT